MPDSLTFTTEVVRCIRERFTAKTAELNEMVETGLSFKEWLVWEAFLACKQWQPNYPFCEVTANPTYTSEGVAAEVDTNQDVGDLRVGGPNDGVDHCWLFAEFVLVHDGNCTGGGWRRDVESAAERLKRLGWKKSASLLVVVVASRTDKGRSDITGGGSWPLPALTDSVFIALPGGGSVGLTAFDIKRNPTDTLTAVVS